MKRCDRCERLTDNLVRNRGEDLCWPCMESEMNACGVDILVTNRSGSYSFIYNTVRDANKIAPRNPSWLGDGRDLTTKSGRVHRPGSRRGRSTS